MANNQGKIQFGIGFNVDKSGLHELKTELQSLQNLTEKDLIKIGSKDAVKDLKDIKATAQQVEDALEKSFNPRLNTTDLTKFRKQLSDSGLSVAKIKTEFEKAGQSGQNAFRNLSSELLTTNKYLKESNKWLDKMGDTLANTVRWSIASAALNTMTGAVQKAWSFTKQLDKSLNNIQIVTNKSAEDMDRFAIKATKAAQALGATTKSYADAALIYYQQGLAEQDVQARAAVTTKVANVTGQNAQSVSENLTAVWNGYKVNAQEAELYIDKLSAVAATTAADLEELSVGMSRVASAASIMGVDIDSLNAQLATIVSVTREAPESIGTALKTVYARMSDIESGLDAETTLGEYTTQMKQMGINVLDAKGNLRDMDDVIEEIGNNWDRLSRNQQVALAQTIAGTRQYSRMMALFDNWDMYQEAKTTSKTSAGELQKQQEVYLESLEGHFNKLTAKAEELYQTLLDPDGLKPLIDALTGLVGLVENFTESLGGGVGLLATMGSLGSTVFRNQITQGITRTARNAIGTFSNKQQEASTQAMINEYDINIDDARTAKLIEAAKARYRVLDAMTDEEKEQSKNVIKQTNEYYKQRDELEKQKKIIDDIASRYADMQNTNDAEEVTQEIGIRVGEIKRQIIESADLEALQQVETSQKAIATKEARIKDARAATYTAYDEGNEEQFEKRFAEWEEQEKILIEKQEEAQTIAENQEKTIAKVVEIINESTVSTMANVEQQEQLKTITEKVNKAYDQNGKIIADNEKEVQDANDAIKEYNKLLEEMAQDGIAAGKSVKQVNEELKKNDKAIEEAEAGLAELKKNFDLTKNINQAVQFTSGIANLATGITTLHNLGSIWSNDDLTTGEKMLQTLLNMTTAFSLLANGINSVKESWQWIKGLGKSLLDAKELVMNAAKAKSIKKVADAKRDEAQATQEQITADGAHVAATGAEIGSTEINSASVKRNTDEKNKNAQATDEVGKQNTETAGETTVNTVATEANTQAQKRNNQAKRQGGGTKPPAQQTAPTQGSTPPAQNVPTQGQTPTTQSTTGKGGWLKKLMTTKGAGGAVGGALGGLIAGTIAAVAIWDVIANEAKRNMEAAQQSAEYMQATLAEVTSQYEKLNSAIQNLSSAEESLKGLTEGTVEWKQALFEVNSQVLELLRQYPELSQYIDRDENGQLSIDKEGLELIQTKQLQQLQTTQAAALLAQTKADNKNIDYLEEEWADAANNSDTARLATIGTAAVAAAGTGAAVGAGVGTAAGTSFPGLGNAIGAVAGTAAGAVAGLVVGGVGAAITEAAEMDNIADNPEFKKVLKQYEVSGKGMFDSEDALAEALGKTKEELTKVEKALVRNGDATIQLCEAVLAQKQQQYDQWVELGKGILGDDASEGAQALAGKEASENDIVSYDDITSQYGWWEGDASDERALKRYLELSGAGTYVGVTGINKGQYRDKNNELQDVDIDEIYKELQHYESLEKVKEKEAEFEAQAARITDLFSDPQVKDAMSELIAGEEPDFRKLTQSEFKKLQDEFGKALGTLTNKEEESIQTAMAQYKEAWQKTITSLPEEIQGAFETAVGGLDLNVDQLKYASELYNSLFDTLGTKGTDAFDSIAATLGEDFGAFIQEVENTQLDSGNIEEQLRGILKGLEVDNVDAGALREFAYALEYLTDAGKGTVEAMQKHYKDVYQVALNLKQFDTVNKEFYDQLSSGQKEYFQLMADGTYQLIKDAKDFYALTQAEQYESNKNAIEESLAYQKKLTAEIDSLERDFADINKDIASEKQWTSKKENLDQAYIASVYAPLEEKVKQIDTTVSVTGAKDSPDQGKRVDVPLTTLLRGVTQEEFDALQIGSTLNGYTLESSTFGMFRRNAYEVQDILALTEAGSQEAVSAWEESFINRILNPLYAEKDRISSELMTNKDKLSQLQKDLPELVTQLFGSLSTFDQYEQILSQWSYLSPDKTMLQNNLLRIAATQYDLKLSDDAYLSKEAIDDYIGEENLANVSDYQTLLAELSLGFDLVDKRQEEAARSLKKYQTIFNELADKEEKLKNFDQQLGAIGQSFTANQEKLNAYSTQNGSLQKQIAANLADTGFINAGGEALTTADIFTGNGDVDLSIYEALKEAYANKDFSSEAEAERAKQTIESIEKYMADKNAVEDAIEQDVANFRDTIAQKFDFTLQMHLDTNTAKKEFLNFQREFEDYLNNDNFTVGGSYLDEAILGLDNIRAFQEGIAALENSAMTDADIEERKKSLNDQYYSEMTNVKAALESYEQARLENIENISDAYEKQLSFLEETNAMLEHQKTLTELIYGDKAAKELTRYYEAAYTNAEKIAAVNEDSYNYWKGEYEKGLENGLEDEELEILFEKMSNSAQSWADSITNQLQVAQEKYLNDIAAGLDQFDQAISNGRGMEALKEEWDWTTEQQNKYLTSLNAVIEKEKLKNTFAKAIDNTSNVKAQQAINKLLSDELTILNSLDKISQKDIERAEKKLSILQAEIALQEAQDAKTQMRLVRGADGTYGYEYTADETKVTEAQEKVLAANQELYNFDSERYQGTLDEWYSLYSEYQTKIEEVWYDGVLSADEEAMLNARKERLTELASEALYQEENLRKTVEDTAKTFGIKASEVSGEINTMFNTGLAAVVKTFVQDKDGVDQQFEELTNSISNKAATFGNTATDLKDSLDTLFYGEADKSGNRSGGMLGAYSDLADDQATSIQNWKDEKTQLDLLLPSYKDLRDRLGEVATSYSNINTALSQMPDLTTNLDAFEESTKSVEGLAAAVNTYVNSRRSAAQAEGYSFKEDGSIDWDGERNKNALNLSLGTSDNSIIEPAKTYGSAEEELRAYIQEYAQSNYGAFGMDSRVLSGLYGQMVTEMTPVTPEGKENKAAGQSSAQDAMRDAFDLITHGYAYTGVTTDMSTINSEWEGFGDNVKIKINDTDYEVEFPHASKNVVGPELQGILSNIYQNPTNGSIAAYNNTPYMYIDKHWFKIEDSNGNFAKAFMQHLRTPHFKTGGLADFTGPAWLDGTTERPELVLNQNDTSNFLDALQILRSLNLSMLQNISGLSNISARFGGATFGTAPIEQTIHITAEFPDATDAEEIKEAFNELVNLATQKALENRN